MRLTVLGGGGAWPTPARGCSGYLLEEDGFTLLVDPGYATVPRLLEVTTAQRVDSVVVSHGHGDHCADLNPLLRARHLGEERTAPLPVYAPAGALDAVLAVDAAMLAGESELHAFTPGDAFDLGPFSVATRPLHHFVPNAGVRLSVGDMSLAYTGDGGADPDVVALADGVTLLLAEATFVDDVPAASEGSLSSAQEAGAHASAARVGQLVLAHLWPGADPDAATVAARRGYDGPISVARPGLQLDLS